MSQTKVQLIEGTSDALLIDSSDRVLVGTSSAVTAPDDKVQINSSSGISVHRGENGTAGPRLDLQKSRNATHGSNTIVQSGDLLGSIFFRGDDGTDYNTPGAQIFAAVDGTPGENDMPGRLVFSTTADGASSPTERMRITSGGDLRFNSGYGSVATTYGVRAWVQFQGSNGTINANGNVSSITRNSTGNYTVNFATAMPDDDYAATCSSKGSWNLLATHIVTTSSINVLAVNQSFNYADHTFISVIVVR